MTRKETILLIVLASINFTNIMDFMIMMPLAEFLTPVFHTTPQQFSMLVSVYAFSAFAASLTASFFIDRFDRKKALVFAFSGLIIGTIACGFAVSYGMLMAARIVAGLFGGLISAQVLSIVGDTFPYEKRGRAMGILMSSFALAAVAGVPIGLYIANRVSWQTPFIGIGIFGLIALPAVFIVLPKMVGHLKKQGEEKKRFEVYRSIWNNPNEQRGLLMMFTLIMGHFGTIPFIAPFLEKNVGFTKDNISLMYFIGGAISLFSVPLIGKLSDKLGKHKVFGILLVLSCIPVYMLTNMPRIPYGYVLIVTGLFFLLAGGRMVPAQALISSVVPPHLRGGFMNINSSLQQLAIGLAAFVGGLMISKNSAGELTHYDWVGYISIVLSLVCLFVMRRVQPVQQTETDRI
jgi:MFS transporter, DHA1 family, inner membrane transport protein